MSASSRNAAALALALAACAPGAESPGSGAPEAGAEESDGAPWFEERAAASGVDFRHESGHADRFLMPEIMGGGAALLDLEGDGDLDLYLVQSGAVEAAPAERPPNRLYRNEGGARFTDVTDGSGADDRGYGMGAACGDVDGDGDTDLYVTNWGANVLLANDGAGRFVDVTANGDAGHDGWGTSAAFLDHDRDGDLDLFVVNYLVWSPATELECHNVKGLLDYCSPRNYETPAQDLLLVNDGSGRLTDASARLGIDAEVGNGLGVGCADFDGDGWTDVFVANDGNPDVLWHNLEGAGFTNEAMLAGCALDQDGLAKAGMGVAIADLDDDADPDLMVCNLNRESDSLYLNQGGWFSDRTAALGLGVASRTFTRFGMGWRDFDNDGLLDLYQANGRVMSQAEDWSDDPYAEPNLLFRGLRGPAGEPRFEEVRPRGGTRPALVGSSRAAAFGDLDGDGGIDVVVVNRDGPAHLLLNRVAGRAPDRHWIRVRVLGRAGSDALGATVTLRAGERTLTRDVRAASSYQASNDPRVQVGLGSATRVDDARVRWVDGVVERFGPLESDREHVLTRYAGEVVEGD